MTESLKETGQKIQNAHFQESQEFGREEADAIRWRRVFQALRDRSEALSIEEATVHP
jgi:hypothetical protein